MKLVLVLAVVAFAISLGIVVGNRMSNEAMAVIIGVVAGALAGFPMSLMLYLIFRRASEQHEGKSRQRGQGPSPGQYPPVVIVNPGGQNPYTMPGQMPYFPAPPPGSGSERQWRIVGDEDEE